MLGLTQNQYGIVQCFEKHVKEIQQKIGKGFEAGTHRNYTVTLGRLKEFITSTYKVKNVPLISLDYKFITDFEFKCSTKWECNANTITKHIQRIRKVISIAMANDWLEKDPFMRYKGKQVASSPKFLTQEELNKIEGKYFEIERLERVKDVFLFSCYTGYAYSDVEKFTHQDIVTGIDGEKWIYTGRKKNNNKSNVPLLPKALAIIEKYRENHEAKDAGKLFPIISNIKTNAYLKEIADVCGITKNLTFHMARHTFATTVTLTNGVPIETVSAMLGHKSLKTTQIYAKVVETKVSNDMLALKVKMSRSLEDKQEAHAS
jgi:site-specific recombinase XerD